MRKYVLLLIGLIIFASCEKEEDISNSQLCADKYFYYSEGSKIFLKHSLYEIWLEFEQSDVNAEKAKSILDKYSFITTDNFEAGNYYDRVKVIINEDCNCSDFKNYLVELNKDIEIYSATPMFYLSDDDPMAYWIMLSEVLTENNKEIISESEFINYAETLNLELIESKYSTQHFKVIEVKTGFEALEIANQIYESEKSQYSHPNFIANWTLY